MITVTPTCRFCQGKLLTSSEYYNLSLLDPEEDNNLSYTSYHEFHCVICDSTQQYLPNGQYGIYRFCVNKKYQLSFIPAYSEFYITQITPQYGNNLIVLKLNFLPTNLTPQNTTEERIKLLILFS